MRLPEPALEAHPINALRELHAALTDVRDRPDCPARLRTLLGFLLAALERYDSLAPTGLTLDAALGLSARSGPKQWWQIERRAKRDRALRAIWRTHYPEADATAAAGAILRDALLLERQVHPSPGTATADLAVAVRQASLPGSLRMLRDILQGEVKQPI